MPTGKHTDPAVKAEILSKIHNGMSVQKAHEIYGVTAHTIYNWLSTEVSGPSNRSLVLENNRLKKELDNAYRVIGELSAKNYPKG